MATVRVVGQGKNIRRDVFEERSMPGQTDPLFLGSKYGGFTDRITLAIKGVGATRNARFLDAVDYIETTLVGLWKTNEEITISPTGDIVAPGIDITVKVDTMTYEIKLQSSSQLVSMTLRGGYSI